ncbi:30S ribosomal protein S14 [Halovenus salina]|uniref:30S ribosomal protein S14 n=1 Tax=Halovenus salina TaxID=1510225 RepID=A0ABD5VXA7_9EURY|nr:30S ribosomal protein S14 [Halovenus salina]
MSDEENTDGQDERERRVCLDTGREQGLVGKYDIWLCRQSFREKARDIGFKKHD